MNQANRMIKFFCFISLIAFCLTGTAQDASRVQVENLSDKQIQQIVTEIQSRGLSMEQAIVLARARGASQIQIDQLSTRIRQYGNKPSASMSAQEPQIVVADTIPEFIDTSRTIEEASDLNKRIFGYQLFNDERLSFEPSVNIATPKNYVLGIDDELQINIWGASQQTYLVTVDKNGTVFIPDLGPILLQGKNFEDAKKSILKRLTSIYNGMGGENPNTFGEVSIQNLRSIKVNIIGEVRTPGTYTLPATASAFNALYLSGGPNENGSFRNIQLIRDNKVTALIDVYDYLIKGNISGNVSLRDQDILLVPTYERRVIMDGNFKRTGIFELKSNEDLDQAIRFAAGFSKGAYQHKLSLTRYTNDQYQLVDVLQEQFSGFIPMDGDSIFAGEVIDRFQNRVSISGAVFRPGEYALSEGMSLLELLQKADGIREDYYVNRGLIIRLDKQLYPTTIPFSVNDVISGKTNILLEREDEVIIRDIFSIGEQPFVNIHGEVVLPGKFDFIRNMTLEDLILLSGGLTEAASQSFIEVARRNSHEESQSINDKMVNLFQFNIDRDLSLNPEDKAFILKPFDHIYVRRAPSYHEQKTVSVEGEVKYPGKYSVSSKTERISDIIARAGGVTPYAFVQGARLNRYKNEELSENIKLIKTMQLSQEDTLGLVEEKIDINRLELRLDKILEDPKSFYDYILEEGDEIYVPKRSDEIWVTGEVLNPIGQAWEKGRNLKYYINRAGGFSSNAKKGKLFVIYSDGTTKVTKNLIGKKYPNPQPGCQIVVPLKPPKPQGDNTSKWLAIAGTLSSLAVAFAAITK